MGRIAKRDLVEYESLLKHPSKRPAWFFHVGRFAFEPLPMTTASGA